MIDLVCIPKLSRLILVKNVALRIILEIYNADTLEYPDPMEEKILGTIFT